MTSDELGMALVYIKADTQRALKALEKVPAELVTSPIGEVHRDLQRAVAFLKAELDRMAAE
jgi:hypothetical protein